MSNWSYLPNTCHHNPLLLTNHPWIITIHKDKIFQNYFKNKKISCTRITHVVHIVTSYFGKNAYFDTMYYTYKSHKKNIFLSIIPLWLMKNLVFEILNLNLKNLENFSGLRNESGPKRVGAQMSWGPNELGLKWVGDQMSRGPNELGPKCVGAQMSQGPKWVGPKWVRGPNEEWAQMCPSQNCHIHDKILYCLITYRNFMKAHEKKTALRLASLAGAATSQADGSPWAC